jgi:two-component system, NarL family, nitrate/nitrite response regulator NarL
LADLLQAVGVVCPASIFRTGFVRLLETMGFDRVQAVDTAAQLVAMADVSLQVVVLADLVDTESIVAAVSELKRETPTAKIVYVADTLDMNVLARCFEAGASGFVLKSISTDALRESLKLVASGEKVLPSELRSLIVNRLRPIPRSFHRIPTQSSPALENDHNHRIPSLSPRETQILERIVRGESNREIATSLGISESTVKVHIGNILKKIHAVNRTQAALFASSEPTETETATSQGTEKESEMGVGELGEHKDK